MNKLTDIDAMPFGKYQGTKMANVPDSYLVWLYDSFRGKRQFGDAKRVREYIEDNAQGLNIQIHKS